MIQISEKSRTVPQLLLKFPIRVPSKLVWVPRACACPKFHHASSAIGWNWLLLLVLSFLSPKIRSTTISHQMNCRFDQKQPTLTGHKPSALRISSPWDFFLRYASYPSMAWPIVRVGNILKSSLSSLRGTRNTEHRHLPLAPHIKVIIHLWKEAMDSLAHLNLTTVAPTVLHNLLRE